MKWLDENKAKSLNEGRALDGNRLIAAGQDAKQVCAEAIAAGVTSPLLHQINETDDLPFEDGSLA